MARRSFIKKKAEVKVFMILVLSEKVLFLVSECTITQVRRFVIQLVVEFRYFLPKVLLNTPYALRKHNAIENLLRLNHFFGRKGAQRYIHGIILVVSDKLFIRPATLLCGFRHRIT